MMVESGHSGEVRGWWGGGAGPCSDPYKLQQIAENPNSRSS